MAEPVTVVTLDTTRDALTVDIWPVTVPLFVEVWPVTVFASTSTARQEETRHDRRRA